MRWLSSGTRFALASVIVLGIVGCQESNESAVDEQARKTAGAKVDVAPPPKDQREFGERAQQTNPLSKGYPGSKAAPKK